MDSSIIVHNKRECQHQIVFFPKCRKKKLCSVVRGLYASTMLCLNAHHAASFTLDTYAHATASMKRDSAQRMDKLIQDVSGL
jgi:hypothetical protein